MVLLDDIQVDERLNYVEILVVILDINTKPLRNKLMELVKVQWQHWKGSEWTWESDEEMKEHCPEQFAAADFEDEV